MEYAGYRKTVRALGVSIFLTEIAIAMAALLLVLALQDSFRVLSIVGIFNGEEIGGLYLGWVALAATVAALAWSEFVFVKRARHLFDDDATPIEAFGTSMADERRDLQDIRISLNKYAIFAIAIALAAALLAYATFFNVLLFALLVAILVGLLMFFREKAKLLRADRELLS